MNGTTIPTIGCTAVAVILQYFYTVTFMWMLMEGIILYIKLVKVFGTEDRKHYVILLLLVMVRMYNNYVSIGFVCAETLQGTDHDVAMSQLCTPSLSSLLISSVLPLVYLILVVPLGLARPGHNTQGTWSYGATSA